MAIKYTVGGGFRMFSLLTSFFTGGQLSASNRPTFHTQDRYFYQSLCLAL